jgi:hypothetical protein
LNGDFEIDYDELEQAACDAEVISIFFPIVRKSLVIDTRFSFDDEPLVRLLPQASSLEERYRSIRRLRPQFPRPENVTSIRWPKYVNSLIQTGVLGTIRERLESSGFQSPVRALGKAVERIHRRERLELASVIQGEHYYTIWARSS